MDEANKQTRMDVIIIKYKNLISRMKQLDFIKPEHTEIIPEISRQNCADVLFFFKFAFTNSSDGFRENLKSIISLKKITFTDDEFEQIFKLVSPFLIFINTFI